VTCADRPQKRPTAVVLRLENTGSEPIGTADLNATPVVRISDGSWVAGGLIGGDGVVSFDADGAHLAAVPREPGDRMDFLLVADAGTAEPALTIRLGGGTERGLPLTAPNPNPAYDLVGGPFAELVPENPDGWLDLGVDIKPLLFGGTEPFLDKCRYRRGRQKSFGRYTVTMTISPGLDNESLRDEPLTVSWRGGRLLQHKAAQEDTDIDSAFWVDATRAVVTTGHSMTVGSRRLPGTMELTAVALVDDVLEDVQVTSGANELADALLRRFDLAGYVDHELRFGPRQLLFSDSRAYRLWWSVRHGGTPRR
jgi:hypothetical protein